MTERAPVAAADPFTERLLAQYHEQYTVVLLEIERMKAEENKIKQEILLYQKRIEDTPKLEQELLLLNRDYDTPEKPPISLCWIRRFNPRWLRTLKRDSKASSSRYWTRLATLKSP